MNLSLDIDYMLPDNRANPAKFKPAFASIEGPDYCVICRQPNDRRKRLTCSDCGGELIESMPCESCEHAEHCRVTGAECATYRRYLDTGRWESLVGRKPEGR